jgi:RecA/RadA recombinase
MQYKGDTKVARGRTKKTEGNTTAKADLQMIGSLVDQLRVVFDKEEIGSERRFIPSYSSSLDVLDYRNGKIDKKGLTIGINGGKIFTIVGKSGTGKSTLAIQIACAIADQFPMGNVIHYDFERATNEIRILNLTGWDEEKFKQKYMHIQKNISAEKFYKGVKRIADIKKANKNLLMYDTGVQDDDGNPIMEYSPTVVILDSLALMTPENIQEEEALTGGMSNTAIAKVNTSIFKRIMDCITDVNIILIVVNHINAKVEIGYSKTQSQINYLDQDETVPGGNAPLYLSDCFIKLISGKKFKPDEEFGINGFQVTVKLIKSRSNTAGKTCELVFDQVNGFNNILSNYLLLKDNGLIGGGGKGFYIKGYEDYKFTQKTIVNKYETDPEFRQIFDSVLQEQLVSFVPVARKNEFADEEESAELTLDEETGYYTDGNGNFYDEDGNQLEFGEEE